MKVCMLAYTFYESDPRVMRYATALTARGDTVDVLALRRDGLAPFEVLDGVNVFRIQTRRVNERGRLSYLARIGRFLLRSAYVLTQRHLAEPYQIIHVHSVPDFLVFAALVPKLLGARVILDIHDILPEFYGSKFGVGPQSVQFKLLLWIENISTRFSHHVIIANHPWKERLATRAVHPAKCTAICNYPDPCIFFPRPKRSADNKFLIIYPGSLNRHQGLHVALQSFAQAASQIPHAEFHIYGEGPERPALEALSEELSLGGRVFFHGFLPVNRIADIMATADLAVEPKIASSGFGNEAASTKIMEFMALGVPVIASRTAVHCYYFNESLVRFVEPENESALAEAILELYRNVALRATLTTNASHYIQQNNWAVKKNEYLQLIDGLSHTT